MRSVGRSKVDDEKMKQGAGVEKRPPGRRLGSRLLPGRAAPTQMPDMSRAHPKTAAPEQ